MPCHSTVTQWSKPRHSSKENQDTHARQATQVSSDTSSVWNFYVRSSDVISLGNQWWCHQMSCKCPLFLRLLKISHTSKLIANERIFNFKMAYPTSVYVFKIVSCSPWADLCLIYDYFTGFSGTGLPFVAVLSVQGWRKWRTKRRNSRITASKE